MAKSKARAEHCIIRNGNLFCTHCGGEHIITWPIDTRMLRPMFDAFVKIHKNCPKTWQPPIVDQSLTEKQKADWWLKHGERGTSSETMFQKISGRIILTHKECPPLDPDDFRRCYLLFETIPEWKEKLYMMKTVSSVWEKIVDNWQKLSEMLGEQMKTGKPNGLYELMKELGC